MQLRQHEGIKSKWDGFRVDPRLLKVEPDFNVRDLDAPAARDALDELKAMIAADGVQVALEIRLSGEDLIVVSGHRRHKVVMELIAEGHEIETVPAVAEPKIISEPDRVARMVTLNQGLPLTPLEKAEIVRRLVGYGWDRQKIAARLGVSPQTVSNLETLLSAPQEVREAVRAGELAATEAVNLTRAEGDKASVTLRTARQVAKERGKPRVTAATLPRSRSQRQPSAPRTPEVVSARSSLLAGLAMLAACLAAEYATDTAAQECDLDADALGKAVEWLMDLESTVRSRLRAGAASA